MSWLSEWKRALQKFFEPEAPRRDRWPVAGLTAFYGLHSPSVPAPIKKIGPGGVYLDIREQLSFGQPVVLKLQKEGDPALSSELQITLQAQVAGQDEFGVQLLLVPPPGFDAAEWEVLIHHIVVVSNPDQVVEGLRILRTILFLYPLCHSGAAEAILLLDGRLDQEHTTTFFKIARAAENLLTADPDAGRLRAHPGLVANLLREGSWSSDELIMQLWIGLFVSSCTVDKPDDSNQVFVDLLVQLTPTEARVFTHACERVLNSASARGDFTSASVVLSANELVKLTGMNDLSRDATDLAYLFNLGLIQNVVDLTTYSEFDKFDVTPSRLGLELYKRCHGKRGKLDPQLAATAREHLALFFPPPIPSAFENFSFTTIPSHSTQAK